MVRTCLALVLAAISAMACLAPAQAQTKAEFPLKDGDIWVMAGDSITAQHQHSNYFEAFCYARYPKLKFAFRNSGVGGHTIPSTLARFNYDIAAWKPTVVSVELGMNDKGGTTTDKFIENMGTMVKTIRAAGARPVILAPSPVNNGDRVTGMGIDNKKLSDYSLALKKFADQEKIPYADQLHELVDIWGKNMKVPDNTLNQIRNLSTRDDIEGAEHLKAFLAGIEKGLAKRVSLKGDAVHPGEPGQLMMAAALLKDLGAEPFVSAATINTATKEVVAKDCVIEKLAIGDGKVSFERLDARSPFPIPDSARPALELYPTILDMSQYLLKVNGLKEGKYELKVDGVPIGTVTALELDKGINLTAFPPGTGKTANPIAAHGKGVLDAVSARAGLVGTWRNMSKNALAKDADPKLMTELAAQTKKVEEGDNRIREAAAPRKMRFEVSAIQ